MIRKSKLVVLLMACMLLLSACGTIDTGSNLDKTNNEPTVTPSEQPTAVFEAEVIQAGDSLLVAPNQDSDEFKSSDRISVGLLNTVITGSEGENITVQDLIPGDILEITYNGGIRESYPAQISASTIKLIGHNNLIDGYLALIDDIYQEDSGLNSEITMIALDTTGWTGLTNIEKEIIFSQVKEKYGLEIVEGTFDELAEQGMIDKDNLYFPEGILIKISKVEFNENKDKITCSIEKWRSGLGAIGSDDVTAKLKDGKWEITKGSMWIS